MEKPINWPAIQGIAGIYCAVLGTVSLLFPAQPGQPPWQAVVRVTAPPVFAIGLAILGGSVGIPGILTAIGVLRRRPVSSLEPTRSRLNILSASWGSTTSRESVLDALNRLPKDALAFGVYNEV